MNKIRLRRNPVTLLPDSARVIIRPFIPTNPERVTHIIERALTLSEEEVDRELAAVQNEFASRHLDLESHLQASYDKVRSLIVTEHPLSWARKVLIGALFSGEYALESAALFNPCIVPHPDQSNAPKGSLRFLMSLRATGEGHISSIEFRTGLITPENSLSLDPVSRFVALPEIESNPTYNKKNFILKLQEMGFKTGYAAVLAPLADNFTLSDLNHNVTAIRSQTHPLPRDLHRTLECIKWLADSNYELRFSPKLAMSERIIFPVSSNESNGIEDARFVRFIEDDGAVMYYATYTAYNGRVILPQFIETPDFLNFRVLTLNGNAVQNKGMALFPRRIDGRFAMVSRQDDENLFIMFSDNLHYWNNPQMLLRPGGAWESVKIGNCGSPIETEAGWLLLTHGVGAMRRYCIGVALLDLKDPTRVLGRLQEPLLKSEGEEREGYVPNVVYSCGALLHGRELILPYALNDKSTVIASVCLDDLLAALKA